MLINPYARRSVEVYEAPPEQWDTGLLDSRGQKIIKQEIKPQIGFIDFRRLRNGES